MCICKSISSPFSLILGGAILVSAIICGALVVAEASAAETTVSASAEVGKVAPAFTLPDTDAQQVSLSDYKGKIVVLEWFCPQCPWSGKASRNSVHSTGQVRELIANLKKVDPDVVYLMVDSSGSLMGESQLMETDEALKKKFGIEGHLLIDWSGKVGKEYGAKTTPHMYVIDKEGILRYQGAFSDRKKTNYVLDAVKQIEAGKPVEPSHVKQWGCGVKYR